MKRSKGISLIVLVITIIIIIILAGTVILSLSNNNLIAKSTEAKFKTNVGTYKSELVMVLSNKYIADNFFQPSTFDSGIWNGTGDGTGTIKEFITSITAEDGAKFEIQDSKLVYVGTDETEETWASEVGIYNGSVTPPEETGLGLNVIATDNKTFDGQPAAYNNPIIPKGFKAINDGTTWPTEWNNGLVIEDETGNQFVWVPVDGTNVPYSKWCTNGVSYVTTTDDSLPQGVDELSQITKYEGFYIARYEAMFDYNGGSIRVASKRSANKTITDWSSNRNNSYTGYLWNFVNYTDAKSYSESMATSYGYDNSKLITHVITGTEWDTVMEWVKDSGKNVIVSTAWGNYSNSVSPANVGNGSLQISGFSENWKANNIYDLAGNTYDLTSELNGISLMMRGASYSDDGLSRPAAYRNSTHPSSSGPYLTFRTALYIK